MTSMLFRCDHKICRTLYGFGEINSLEQYARRLRKPVKQGSLQVNHFVRIVAFEQQHDHIPCLAMPDNASFNIKDLIQAYGDHLQQSPAAQTESRSCCAASGMQLTAMQIWQIGHCTL